MHLSNNSDSVYRPITKDDLKALYIIEVFSCTFKKIVEPLFILSVVYMRSGVLRRRLQ